MNMKQISIGLALLILTGSAMGDIWSSLFKEKLAEAKNGSSEAQYDVGTMYQNGRGIAADRGKAIEWFRKAAAQGDAKSASRLQLMEANTARFEKTARLANKGDEESRYDLGNMFLKGVGTNIDHQQAIAAFEQSASQGHVKSAYKLGLVYYEGDGIKRDSKKAYNWFRQAAEKGYPAAQYYLGKLFADGTWVRRDPAEALMWFGKAVDGGFDQARGEMINVSESMNAAATARPPTSVAQVEHTARPKQRRSAPRTQQAPVTAAPAQKRYNLEDVVLATWTRNGKPVAYLPSAINSCRTEGDRVICFSDDQTRTSPQGTIRFKTKAIISHFSDDGSFKVNYRNLVINSTQAEASVIDDSSEEVGDTDSEGTAAYAVKTGWSNPHKLVCTLKNGGTVSCLKNRTHAIVLTSPTSLAAGQ